MSKRVRSKYKINRRLGATSGVVRKARTPVNMVLDSTVSAAARCRISACSAGEEKLKGYYGNITEKQLCRIYGEAVKRRGDTVEALIGLLEQRLDAVVYRMKFVPTVFASRQFINHGHVKVNGVRVTIPSYRVKEGDVIEVREKSRNIPMVLEAGQLTEREVPEYMEVDYGKMKGTFLRVPEFADVPIRSRWNPTSSSNSIR